MWRFKSPEGAVSILTEKSFTYLASFLLGSVRDGYRSPNQALIGVINLRQTNNTRVAYGGNYIACRGIGER
jgi:hypothetical protein